MDRISIFALLSVCVCVFAGTGPESMLWHTFGCDVTVARNWYSLIYNHICIASIHFLGKVFGNAVDGGCTRRTQRRQVKCPILQMHTRPFLIRTTHTVCPRASSTVQRTIKIVYRCDLKALILFSIRSCAVSLSPASAHRFVFCFSFNETNDEKNKQFINYDSV